MRKHITRRTVSERYHDQFVLSAVADLRNRPDGTGVTLRERTVPGLGIGYSTLDDYSIRFPITPGAAAALLILDYSATLPEGASLGFAIGDDTTRYTWTGAAWAVAGAGVWNTIADFNLGLPSWATPTDVSLWINLKTTDPEVTPVLASISLLWQGSFDYRDDLIYRTLIPYLEAIRIEGRMAYAMPADGTTVDLDLVILEAGYNIVGLFEAFNHTNDPRHTTDILSTYNPATKLATFTGAQSAGETIWFGLSLQPWILVSESEDYTEIEKVPSIVVTQITVQNRRKTSARSIVNRGTNVAWKSQREEQQDYLLSLDLNCPEGVVLEQMASAIVGAVADQSYLESAATGERFDLLLGASTRTPGPRADDLKAMVLPCRILNVGALHGTWQQITGVETLRLGFVNKQDSSISTAETIEITD
jgi:hypothetical protein